MLFPVKLPPGVVRYGTEYASKGRYFAAYHVRWNEDGTLKPTGGWRLRSENVLNVVTGKARALFPWKDNSSNTWLAIGTHSGLFIQNRAGTVYDITPSGFTTGRADADAVGGFGAGPFGGYTYGTPRPDSSAIQPATQWTLDNFGEMLIGVSPDDGTIYKWELVEADPAEELDSGAPTCKAVVVTQEGFIFALASTNPRTVSWCDQRDAGTWTPAATNQAGDFELQTAGSLMCGKVVKGGVLLFTDLDVHLGGYIGGTLVYSFDKLASACGIISRQAVAAIDAQAVWMGRSSFWLYNGYVQKLPCDVEDYVFSDFNTLQASKTYAVRDSANNEIQFYYCSANSTEIDRCVIWNYLGNYWNIGRVARTCGADRGVFTYPIFVNSSGHIYEHEVTANFDGGTPYAEAGPLEIGNGDNVVHVTSAVPDEKTSGECNVTFYGKFLPNGTEETKGPYTLSERVDLRICARQAKLRVSQGANTDWRYGGMRLDGTIGGRR